MGRTRVENEVEEKIERVEGKIEGVEGKIEVTRLITLVALVLTIAIPALNSPASDPGAVDNASFKDTGTVTPTPKLWGLDPNVKTVPRRYVPADFDMPLELNDVVWEHIMMFQRGNGKGVRLNLERGGFFIEQMRQILWEEGCPRDLVYLAMIESGFQPTARSVVDAAGMWQFMESTGKLYGLTVSEWVDERLDVEKSTHAAGRFLTDLYDRFESWPLVLAAYNAGPGAVNRSIKKRHTENFWELRKYDDLKAQTKVFVPKFYAALIISKHPERFGITELEPREPHNAEKFTVPPLTGMLTISRLSGAPYEQIVDLNAQYLFESTPPTEGPWTVRVPKKYTAGLQAKIDELKKKDRNVFVVHKVRRGESIYTLARKYHIPSRVIIEANGLKSVHLKAGSHVVIPKRSSGPPERVTREPEVKKVGNRKYMVKYTVGEGDSLWKIARKADVHITEVCEWNSISKDDPIYPGQQLVLYCTDGPTARRIGREGNKNRSKSLSGTPRPRTMYHTVRGGENLSKIANKYGVTVDQIVGWNHLKNPNQIKVGQKLKIYR